jgi:hypothetical protein
MAVGTIHGRCNAPRCPKLHPQADALLCFLVKVYVASKAKHAVWWQALRAAGVPIVASWIDAPFNHDGSELSADEWREHWEKCCREASEADIVLMFACAEERQNGALIEAGAALGAGKRVYLVSPHNWSWKHHPRCRTFATLADAITAIQAAAAGERARQAASLFSGLPFPPPRRCGRVPPLGPPIERPRRRCDPPPGTCHRNALGSAARHNDHHQI